MPRPKIMWASVALGFLTLGELVSLYQLMFDIWMTAYPFADTGEWRRRFYIRLTTTIVIGLLWSTLAVWLSDADEKLVTTSARHEQCCELRPQLSGRGLTGLVQPERESGCSPLENIPRFGIFKASIRPPGYPSARLRPRGARFRFAR